ncbi:hypothetical protein CDD82_1024 [Ophiocordyceps australis]|uniref:deuterolysin n=1 Tax=Ophiocordyceps australis TaxID=1399860 RepID=A0A2C5ZNB7_9HYPO|nr:hypothetical protein CDD82_1024 [Ophiocordyceps australis]
MKYALALASVAWTAAAAPSNLKRSPMSVAGPPVASNDDTFDKRDPMSLAGMPIKSEGETHFKRSPTSLLNLADGQVAVDTGEFLDASQFSKRAQAAGDCGAQQSIVDEGLSDCAKMANLAAEDAKNPSSTLFPLFFKNDDEGTRNKVAALMTKIAQECGATNQGNAVVRCSDSQGQCASSVNSQGLGALAFGTKAFSDPRILLCQSFFELNENTCGRLTPGHVVLHEMSHGLGSTDDVGYGIQAALQLDAGRSLQNADSFGFYAGSLLQGCTAEDLQAGRPPSGSPPAGRNNTNRPGPGNGTGPNKGNPLDDANPDDPFGGDEDNTIGNPNTGRPNSGSPNTGGPNSGNPNSGNPNSGNPNSGNPNSGSPNSGSPRNRLPGNTQPTTGGPNTGRPRTGNPNTGGPRTGNPLNGPEPGNPLNGLEPGNPLNGPEPGNPLGNGGNSPLGNNINGPFQGSPLGNNINGPLQAGPIGTIQSSGTGTQERPGTGLDELPDEIKALLPPDATNVEIIDASGF